MSICSLPQAYAMRSGTELFPATEVISQQVTFWKKVFGLYGTRQILIHDAHRTHVVVDLVDINQMARNMGPQIIKSQAMRDRLAERYLERYQLGIARFRSEGKRAVRHGAIEERLLAVYGRSPELLQRLLTGRVELRLQVGMNDEFNKGIERSRNVIATMENIFRQNGLPAELTRIPFIESMFHLEAESKVGAVGVWQFMPETARQFMHVSRWFDERRSPLKATKAATKLLAFNYRMLKSWPLAVTAYNHGAGGMQSAVRSVGSTDLSRIVNNYRSKSFGFASKNFYAEFLAIKDLYADIEAKRGSREAPLKVATVRVNNPVTLAQITRQTPLDADTLLQLNPCINSGTLKNQTYMPLPRDYELFVPTQMAGIVQSHIDSLHSQKWSKR